MIIKYIVPCKILLARMNSPKLWRSGCFTARCYAQRVYEIPCRLSVRLSVTLRYRDHIGWNIIILQPTSLRPMRLLTTTWAIWCNGDTSKLGGIGVGSGAQKACKSPKRCKIGPRLLLRTKRKSHTRFRLVVKSMTLGDLERRKRLSCRNEIVFWVPPEKFEWR